MVLEAETRAVSLAHGHDSGGTPRNESFLCLFHSGLNGPDVPACWAHGWYTQALARAKGRGGQWPFCNRMSGLDGVQAVPRCQTDSLRSTSLQALVYLVPRLPNHKRLDLSICRTP